MPITYSVAPLKNPRDPEGEIKYYAKAQAAGVITIDQLADDISYSTTLTDGDVLNVIRALIKQIKKHIAQGEIVRLENLGSFQVQLSSEGALTSEDFTPAKIRKIRLQFRPGKGLTDSLQVNAQSFKKVKPIKTQEEETVEVIP